MPDLAIDYSQPQQGVAACVEVLLTGVLRTKDQEKRPHCSDVVVVSLKISTKSPWSSTIGALASISMAQHSSEAAPRRVLDDLENLESLII